jgi:hypothetical protein
MFSNEVHKNQELGIGEGMATNSPMRNSRHEILTAKERKDRKEDGHKKHEKPQKE